jgi:5-methylcytosine-specific restriction endonuclease McrBC regulatory subunit McrC
LLDRDEKVVNVMTFTDGDLKRLKEENECGFCSPRVTGLINRLEAAEKAVEASEVYRIYRRAESGIFDKPNEQVKDLDKAIFEWRKAAGRE